jgi:hypothetical protein
MGHIPRVHQAFRITSSPPLNDHLTFISQVRKDTAEAMRRSQALEVPSNFTPYNIGDHVWLEAKNLNTTHPSAKLAPRRYGPFRITGIISRTSFRIKLPSTWKIHNVFHGSLLTQYKETTMNGNRYQEPVPDLIDGQPEWEVECILGTRKRHHQLQYLVRWKGFSEAHDSWEPLTNLNADELIKKYYQENPLSICTTYKDLSQHYPVIIQNISIMSNASSPPSFSLLNSPEPTTPTYPDSPPALPIPPPLAEQISDPPAPLTLLQCISTPTLEEVITACNKELGNGPQAYYNDPWRTPMCHYPPPTPSPPRQSPPNGVLQV